MVHDNASEGKTFAREDRCEDDSLSMSLTKIYVSVREKKLIFLLINKK